MAAGASTASPPVLTPTSSHFNYEVWVHTVEGGTYQKRIFIPRIKETMQPYSKAHIRKYARMSAVVLAGTSPGTGLTYQDPLGVEVTLTPAGNYVALAWSESEDATNEIPLDSDLAGEAEQALAEADDTTVLANVAGLSTFRGNAAADADAALLRNSMALLTVNTNGRVVPGETTVYGLLDASQYGPVMSIPEFTNAQIRGDAENPQVKGIWRVGGGITLSLTTVCTTDANGTHGVLWIPEAFVIGWNVRTKTKRQDLELQNRLILYDNFGSTVQHDLRAVGMRTANVIP